MSTKPESHDVCVFLKCYPLAGIDIYHVFVFGVIIKMRNQCLSMTLIFSLILLRRCESNNAHKIWPECESGCDKDLLFVRQPSTVQIFCYYSSLLVLFVVAVHLNSDLLFGKKKKRTQAKQRESKRKKNGSEEQRETCVR